MTRASTASKDELHQALASAMLAVTSDVDAFIAMSPAAVAVFKSASQAAAWAVELDRLDLAKRAIAVLRAVAAERTATPEVAREQRAVAKAVKELRAAARPPRTPRRR